MSFILTHGAINLNILNDPGNEYADGAIQNMEGFEI